MANLLEHLGKDTLPLQMVKEFTRWCVLKQARPALAIVLHKASMTEIATAIEGSDEISALATLSAQANQIAKESRGKTGPLALSAAEATTFEFANMINALSEESLDPEGVSFFSARVCGWAGWAENDFSTVSIKSEAEQTAKNDQEAHLSDLWRKYATQESSTI